MYRKLTLFMGTLKYKTVTVTKRLITEFILPNNLTFEHKIS